MNAGVTFVVGTRPEAIKLAPVARALVARGIAPTLLLTGQHPGLEPGDYGFPAVPALTLHCRGCPDPSDHASAVSKAALPHLRGAGLVLVQGDTSSALGGALAASSAGVPLGHVEAGLRSHDSRNPWPEEGFRIAIDAVAALLFAPTELSAANLRREGVGGLILVTGNTGIDAALGRCLPPRPPRQPGPAKLLVTCHRRESWGDGLASIAVALKQIAASGAAEVRFVLHPNPCVASAMRQLLGRSAGIELCPPCSHDEMLRRIRAADLVLSDSGGIQEEAAVLGAALLVLRERTERPEAIASGNIELVGVGTERIVSTVRRLLADPERLEAMRRPSLPYGDGHAAARIAEAVAQSLNSSSRSCAA